MTYTITRDDGADDAAALRYALEFASVKHSTHSTALRALADSIEEQVKPAIEEPVEFGSIVRAGRGGSDRVLWQHATNAHYWLSETGIEDVWSELTDVEVLRAGVGEPSDDNMTAAEFDRRFEAGAPVPVEVSLNGRRICISDVAPCGEQDCNSCFPPLGDSRTEKDAYAKGVEIGRSSGFGQAKHAMHRKLLYLLAESITSERKNALEKAIQAVEELAP